MQPPLYVARLRAVSVGQVLSKDMPSQRRLVAQAGYEGAAKDRVLRDTIISGIASEKIRAKIVKEGHEVTLN